MAHVVCDPCGRCDKDRCTAPCVLACPHEAFYTVGFTNRAGTRIMINIIDPVACTDCRACVAACPSRAIFHEDIVPDEWQRFVLLNYLRSRDPSAEHCPRPLSRPFDRAGA